MKLPDEQTLMGYPVGLASKKSGIGVALLLVAAATVLSAVIGKSIELTHDVDLLYFPIVVYCAVRYNYRTAATAAIVSAICWDYFLTKPIYSLAVASAHDIFTLIAFLLISLLVSRLAQRLNDANRRAAVLNERNRMAQEMHDTLAQGLTGIVIQLQAAERVQLAPGEKSIAIDQARRLAQQCLEDARRSVKALKPAFLVDQSFTQALEQIAQLMTHGTGIDVSINVIGEETRLDELVELNLLRIGQEALTNALKHSGATDIDIEVSYSTGYVKLVIRDNGRGFDADVAQNQSHAGSFGLAGIRDRTSQLAGTFLVDTKPGVGACITVSIPVSSAVRVN